LDGRGNKGRREGSPREKDKKYQTSQKKNSLIMEISLKWGGGQARWIRKGGVFRIIKEVAWELVQSREGRDIIYTVGIKRNSIVREGGRIRERDQIHVIVHNGICFRV